MYLFNLSTDYRISNLANAGCCCCFLPQFEISFRVCGLLVQRHLDDCCRLLPAHKLLLRLLR